MEFDMSLLNLRLVQLLYPTDETTEVITFIDGSYSPAHSRTGFIIHYKEHKMPYLLT